MQSLQQPFYLKSYKQGDDSIITGGFTDDQTIAIKGAVALKAQWLGLGSGE